MGQKWVVKVHFLVGRSGCNFALNKQHKKLKKIVIFTGAGVSAESGISTFRDSGGLWEKHRIEDVATPEAFKENPERVLDFYNQRRRKIREVQPNAAHIALASLESDFNVHVITQNIDDLHERAGSRKVLHLHGLITQARDEHDDSTYYEIGFSDIQLGSISPQGGQLRPNIVWFGEEVPMMDEAIPIVNTCDVFIVIGTSLNRVSRSKLGALYTSFSREIRCRSSPKAK